jgi:hypothetical protein
MGLGLAGAQAPTRRAPESRIPAGISFLVPGGRGASGEGRTGRGPGAQEPYNH